jgi:predicted TIM-barrel fold metal-dependent hydrolase
MFSRRQVMGGAGVLVASSLSAPLSAGASRQPSERSDESHKPGGKTMPASIIDFRVRPPFRTFRSAFHPRLDPAKSDDELMESFMADMDRAGVGFAVAEGRTVHSPNARATKIVGGNVSNDDVEALVKAYPDRFVGFGSVDVGNPAAALKELDRCRARGFAGVAFYNPVQTPPLYDDDESLFPIYERCAKLGLIASITGSIMVGPDMSYSMPIHIQRVALAFPDLRIVIPHGCWPWTNQIVGVLLQGVLFKASQVYIVPDFYLSQRGLPGRQDYIDVVNDVGGFGINQRILYASSYPALSITESAEVIKSTEFRDEQAYAMLLHDNAARLLGR